MHVIQRISKCEKCGKIFHSRVNRDLHQEQCTGDNTWQFLMIQKVE
jgi:hypothetical protein